MTKRLTPIKAIRKKCIDCCAGLLSHIRNCTCVDCSLFPYRMGKRPRKQGENTLKTAKNDKSQEVKGNE